MKKYFLLLFLIIFTIISPIHSQYKDTLLNCDFLFEDNLISSIFSWLVQDVPIIRSFIPENEFLQLYNEEKKEFCIEIVNSNELNKTEKKVRIAQLYNLDSREFHFGIIDSYHEKINPENLTFGDEINSTILQNIGYKYITMNPSVQINNTIYITPQTTALRSYHFNISIPKDYISQGYPEELNGYCEIIHNNIRTNTKETIFFNNEIIASYDKTYNSRGKIEEILTNTIQTDIEEGEITINSNLEIESSYTLELSVWNPFCCAFGESGCIQTCYECRNSQSELITDRVILTDNYYVTRYNPKIQDEYEIWYEDNLIWIKLYITDIDKYKRVMIDRYLEMENYYSVLRYKFEPHDFLYFEAVPYVKNSFTRMGETQEEIISSRLYYYKSPLLSINEDHVLFATNRIDETLTIEFETFFDSPGFFNWGNEKLRYDIDLNHSIPFENIILRTNQFFYDYNETIQITPYLITKNGLYIDDIKITYLVNGEEHIQFTRTNQSIKFDYKGEGEILLEYAGNDMYYRTIHRKNIVRRPLLLRYLQNILF